MLKHEDLVYKGFIVTTVNKKINCQSLYNNISWLFDDYGRATEFMDWLQQVDEGKIQI